MKPFFFLCLFSVCVSLPQFWKLLVYTISPRRFFGPFWCRWDLFTNIIYQSYIVLLYTCSCDGQLSLPMLCQCNSPTRFDCGFDPGVTSDKFICGWLEKTTRMTEPSNRIVKMWRLGRADHESVCSGVRNDSSKTIQWYDQWPVTLQPSHITLMHRDRLVRWHDVMTWRYHHHPNSFIGATLKIADRYEDQGSKMPCHVHNPCTIMRSHVDWSDRIWSTINANA